MSDLENPSPELTTWGVGPWQGEWPEDAGTPDAPNPDSILDPELLANGDTRNVLDKFRYWKMEAIVAELDRRRHKYHVAIENWQHDLNIGSIVRTANAFLAEEVHIIGNRRWNRRGAMVTDRYQHVSHHPTVEEFVAWAKERNLPIIAIDNVPGCQKIEEYSLPEECVLLFGQEGPGLSEAAIEAAHVVLEITQFGSTRSINASAAAAITMHQWVMQHVFNKR
ncbi:TrmH family RNA methyltransferase [Rhodoluna lacicola]|uniref:TrmH family RNA methyltransferase n=1 Tax=Rhodoluna lacicola TaxID=529884 RepID=UPI00223004E3|nr:TrmH family RNA methyltransferase [Rhodoluna lacicola]BDS51053.1 rRNA methyltransferase [Rhodoluna lacicola]